VQNRSIQTEQWELIWFDGTIRRNLPYFCPGWLLPTTA